jgi:hypothetical protein
LRLPASQGGYVPGCVHVPVVDAAHFLGEPTIIERFTATGAAAQGEDTAARIPYRFTTGES